MKFINMKTKAQIIQEIEEAEVHYQQVSLDPYRLKFHLMPLVGSLGDPNGMNYVSGVYHLYFIYSPRSYFNESRSVNTWGHYTTKDFIHFKRQSNTLYPDIKEDRNGIYSGCIYFENGVFHTLYTGNVRLQGDYDYVLNGREQNLIYTYSKDGIHFDYPKTVLMKNEDYPSGLTLHVRDPKIYKENDIYYMVLGARKIDDSGCVLLYQSTNLKDWQFIHEINTLKPFGYMWECPDLICLDHDYFLITCPQGVKQQGDLYQNQHQCGYFKIEGDFKSDYQLKTFKQFDYGFDFYAARTFSDGKRTILVAWLGMSESEYTINHITQKNGWQQAIALPRVLVNRNGQIYQQPLEEMTQLRQSHHRYLLNQDQVTFNASTFELVVAIEDQSNFTLTLKNDCVLHYQSGVLSLNMEHSGDGRLSRYVKLSQLYKLQIFVDTSAIEIFVNDGELTMSSRVFDLDDCVKIVASKAKVDYYQLSGYIYEM